MALKLSKCNSLFAAAIAAFTLLTSSLANSSEQSPDTLPDVLLNSLHDSPHTELIDEATTSVRDYELGLGAMRKIEGSWQFKHSERISGQLRSSSWQVVDDFTAEEVLENIVAEVKAVNAIELQFSCDGRSCGPASEWANKVFRERILYGREDLQRYRVFVLRHDSGEYRLILYAAARTSDRQYLRFDIISVGEGVLTQ